MTTRTVKDPASGHTFRTASQRRFVLFGIYQGEPHIIRRSDNADTVKRLAQATDFVVDFVGRSVWRPQVRRWNPSSGWEVVQTAGWSSV